MKHTITSIATAAKLISEQLYLSRVAITNLKTTPHFIMSSWARMDKSVASCVPDPDGYHLWAAYSRLVEICNMLTPWLREGIRDCDDHPHRPKRIRIELDAMKAMVDLTASNFELDTAHVRLSTFPVHTEVGDAIRILLKSSHSLYLLTNIADTPKPDNDVIGAMYDEFAYTPHQWCKRLHDVLADDWLAAECEPRKFITRLQERYGAHTPC
jgi:hypothetical protein